MATIENKPRVQWLPDIQAWEISYPCCGQPSDASGSALVMQGLINKHRCLPPTEDVAVYRRWLYQAVHEKSEERRRRAAMMLMAALAFHYGGALKDLSDWLGKPQSDEVPRRYDQCDDTCTVDCGHCKGNGPPVPSARPLTQADHDRAHPGKVCGLCPDEVAWRQAQTNKHEEFVRRVTGGRRRWWQRLL